MSRLRLLTVVALAFSMLAVTAAPALAQGGPRMRPETWVDEELFNGVVTPATFDPASDPFDKLFNCGAFGGFLDGVPLISESGPGDTDYNGGRWEEWVIDPEGDAVCADYSDADSVDDLDTSDFVLSGKYFECPLLPSRGRN